MKRNEQTQMFIKKKRELRKKPESDDTMSVNEKDLVIW